FHLRLASARLFFSPSALDHAWVISRHGIGSLGQSSDVFHGRISRFLHGIRQTVSAHLHHGCGSSRIQHLSDWRIVFSSRNSPALVPRHIGLADPPHSAWSRPDRKHSARSIEHCRVFPSHFSYSCCHCPNTLLLPLRCHGNVPRPRVAAVLVH